MNNPPITVSVDGFPPTPLVSPKGKGSFRENGRGESFVLPKTLGKVYIVTNQTIRELLIDRSRPRRTRCKLGVYWTFHS